MSGRDDVAGCLSGQARGDRRGNAFFWSPLSLRICLSPAKNGVLRLSTGRNFGWPAVPSNMDVWRSGDGEILSHLLPVTLEPRSRALLCLPLIPLELRRIWEVFTYPYPYYSGVPNSRAPRYSSSIAIASSTILMITFAPMVNASLTSSSRKASAASATRLAMQIAWLRMSTAFYNGRIATLWRGPYCDARRLGRCAGRLA
jgi:hypothetical protein